MSGTSMDAIDVALVRFNHDSLSVIDYEQYPMDDKIRDSVRRLTVSSSIEEISRLDVLLGHLFADGVLAMLKKAGLDPDAITAVGNHGQTVLHLPDAAPPRTLQIGDANIIALKTGITTVADFRRMDIAAGGQGAPLAPAFHAAQLTSSDKHRVILNLGGMANITILPRAYRGKVTGFDTGPGNALLDDWTQRHLGQPFDKDGQWAASGRIDQDLLQHLIGDPYFALTPPKSTGRDYFSLDWLDKLLAKHSINTAPADIQATLAEFSAATIHAALHQHAPLTEEILLCGGGIHNPFIIERLREKFAGMELHSTRKYGLDPDCVEAVAFAWLAKRRLDGLPGNLPSVTGARGEVILGAVYSPQM